MNSLTNHLTETRALVDDTFNRLLPIPVTKEKRVIEAMRYSAIGGGKAIRPFLVLTVADLLGVARNYAVYVACALEMVHTYSLIHDDLPAMDNDVLRRGKATNHIRYDEATAILAGDGLLTKAFEILSDRQTHPDGTVRCRLINALARAAGTSGMIGGQMIDLIGEHTPLSLEEIERMQLMKTGALLKFACTAPTLMTPVTGDIMKALETYAGALGLLFQITDDILDIEGNTRTLGKTIGKDTVAQKSTFVSVLGMDEAKATARSLAQKAMDAADIFKEKGSLLKTLITFILTRNN
ncbi:MAG: polyprenyl synthetase family protein [Alphaproteobacteria bacterium]